MTPNNNASEFSLKPFLRDFTKIIKIHRVLTLPFLKHPTLKVLEVLYETFISFTQNKTFIVL